MLLYSIFTLLLVLALAVVLLPILKTRLRPSPRPSPSRGEGVFILAVVVSFFAIGFGLYAVVGAPRLLPLLDARQAKLEELKASITSLSKEVRQNPKNLSAWMALGRDFVATAQYDAAANALKQAVIISGGHPEVILAYAEAQIFAADGKVTDDAKKGLDMVVMQQPENPEARYWLILRKLQDGHTEEAMQEMKELYRSLPEDSPLKAMIDRQIGK